MTVPEAVAVEVAPTEEAPAPVKYELTLQDLIAVQGCAFNWADSYDAKDWDRLASIIAPTLLIDYTHVSNRKWEKMPAKDFVDMMREPGFLGDPLLKTQHLLGMTEWIKISETDIIGHHQLRAAHLRFTDETHEVEENRGHSHATNEHYYKKVDGVWKFAGLKPYIRWNEYQFSEMFKGFTPPKR